MYRCEGEDDDSDEGEDQSYMTSIIEATKVGLEEEEIITARSSYLQGKEHGEECSPSYSFISARHHWTPTTRNACRYVRWRQSIGCT